MFIVSFIFLSSIFLGAFNVVFELNVHLALIRLLTDKRVSQQLVNARPLQIVLNKAALNKC